MAKTGVYKVLFTQNGSIYEIYVKNVMQSNLLGFIEVETLLFDEQSGVLVDPSEERLKTEFANVNRSYLPMHSIIRIDEMEKEGQCKIQDVKDSAKKVTPFPGISDLISHNHHRPDNQE